MKEAEFDRFAAEYRAMHAASLGALGGEPDDFARYKVADVATEARGRRAAVADILDFGAGCGNAVPHFREFFPASSLTCVDVSRESLEIARTAWPSQATYLAFDGVAIPAPPQAFDIVFSACVFHHIDHAEHAMHLSDLHRVLRPGGFLLVYEHNPYNPLTVRVVNRCAFDANARLVRAGAMKRRMEEAGFVDVAIRYRTFVPMRLRALRGLEAFLKWLPLGAQYYAIGRRGVA